MNILVTGGAGYIGSVTTEMLLEHGHRVIVIDDLRDGNRESVLEPAVFINESFNDGIMLNVIFDNYDIDVVLHFAASANISFSMTNPKAFFKNNVINGIKFLDWMLKFNCKKIIFSSSAAVYGGPKYIPINEDHPKEPINSYGESKLMFEKILYWYYKAYGVQSNSFRYFNAAGASKQLGEARKQESHLLPLAIDAVLGKQDKLLVYGNDYETRDGTCIRDFVHVLDIARAHVLAINNLDKHPCEVYNLGSGTGYSILEVVKAVEKVGGKKVNCEFTERRQGDPAFLVADYTKAKQDLNWQPEYSLEQMIASTYEWQKIGKGKLLNKNR